MKIKLFTVPNIITLLNLLCGVLAIVETLVGHNYMCAFWLIVLAAIFDFLDGFAARLLHSQSEIGVQLDSLSDLISFGLAPTFVLFTLALNSDSLWFDAQLAHYLAYATFAVVAFSSLRLAKFNIDDQQSENFVGLPTPASALFCVSLGLIFHAHVYTFNVETLVAVALVDAILMVSPLKMFSLKFKGLSWHKNSVRYIFLAIAAIQIALLGLLSLPAIIVSYILMSLFIELRARLT